MNLQRRDFLLVVTLAGAAATPAWGQLVAPPAGPAVSATQSAASTPDFSSGIWAHPSLGFESPLSGPGPVVNKSRTPTGARNFNLLVGDYSNPILKPHAAEIVKKRGEISLSGLAFPDPDNQCTYQPVPYLFWNFEIQMLQRPDKITILYNHDHEFREVRMNQPHPAQVTPSAHGDSVGHYEGDTLVIDTVGIKVGRYTMIDRFGTPYTEALHVVERYRFLDYEAAKEAQERGQKEWPAVPAYPVNPDYKGKGLQLEFTVEDEGVFTTPWTATITYRRALREVWDERICAENVQEYYAGHQYYSEKDARVPTADKPDF
jgi:hypothetical protein